MIENDENLIQAMAELWASNEGDADGFWMLKVEIFDAIKDIEDYTEQRMRECENHGAMDR